MRVGPLIVLVSALAVIAALSQRLGAIDTVVMLACGAAAGAALAALAQRRGKPSR